MKAAEVLKCNLEHFRNSKRISKVDKSNRDMLIYLAVILTLYIHPELLYSTNIRQTPFNLNDHRNVILIKAVKIYHP